MRLFNQTKNALSFKVGGGTFTCDPWGPVDVPSEFLVMVQRRGIPLGAEPVAPETRAQVRVASEVELHRSDAIKALKATADEAQASECAIRAELDQCQVDLSAARSECRELREKLERVTGKAATLEGDKKAAEDLFAEMSLKAADAEERAIRAEALLAEASKPKRTEKAPEKQPSKS